MQKRSENISEYIKKMFLLHPPMLLKHDKAQLPIGKVICVKKTNGLDIKIKIIDVKKNEKFWRYLIGGK